ncbi:MAG: ATP synthase subunit I [Eubacteriales bacterium]|nr:ATP synthase subunit I [Eubacteriales bacterium]
MNIFSNTAPAVKNETKFVALVETVGVLLMIVVFAVLHWAMPAKIPFDWTVVLGGIAGGIVAVLNFFLMGVTIQKAASMDNEENARKLVQASYSRRMLLQMAWVIVGIVAPCFQFAAALIPLLLPGIAAKLRGFQLHSVK